MKIRVRSFASLADITGPELAIEVSHGATVGSALAVLSQRFPPLAARLEGIRYAKNATFVETNSPLTEGDELALIPPVSGG